MKNRQLTGLWLGPVVFMLILLLPVPASMAPEAHNVAAAASLMAIWWVTEAIPIPATALLPIVLFPSLGVMDTSRVTSAYAHHLIFLFMGGFFIAVTMEKWNLHRRIALHTINLVGVTPRRIILGFMLATAFLSMWISNTASTLMMVTIAMAVLSQTSHLLDDEASTYGNQKFHFGTALMLGIAYAASIGGVATLIGTPPNAILAGIVEKTYGYQIGFAEWMTFGLPLSAVMLFIAWFYLTRLAWRSGLQQLPGGREIITKELAALGPISAQERRVLAVFLTVATAWILRGLLDLEFLKPLRDSTIAILGALALFVIPANLKKREFLLDWETAVKIPWDIILLFGGGFALAQGFSDSGLTEWIAQRLSVLEGVSMIGIIALIVLLVIFLTEVTSNTATATLLLPIMGALAISLQVHPFGLMVAVAIASSFAFMLPVATPPNAIVFGSRQVSIPQMAMAGIWLNLLGCLLVTLFIYFLLPSVWQIDLHQLPDAITRN